MSQTTRREAVLNCVTHYDNGDGVSRFNVYRGAYVFKRTRLSRTIDSLLATGELRHTESGMLTCND